MFVLILVLIILEIHRQLQNNSCVKANFLMSDRHYALPLA